MMNAWLPLLVLLSSFVTGMIIFPLPDRRVRLRTTLNLAGATVKLILVGVIFVGFFGGNRYEARLPFLPGLDLLLRVDSISLLFLALSAVLWFLTTIYAVGYLEDSPHRSRFFGFFSMSVTATVGVALAGNLFTFLVFYEMLTLASYPLVVHRGTAAALRAGRIYLLYTFGGGAAVLAGTAWLQVLTGPVEFQAGGVLGPLVETHPNELRVIFALLALGFGVKAALVPLHGWLPTAMVAPAPVSALLHAVAVVKAGAYGIARLVGDLYGIEAASTLGVLGPLAVLAGVTILYGSLRALAQNELKKRLAFSTISQLSYITLGIALVDPVAAVGGLVHLVHQGIMKVTLFYCAGNIASELDLHDVRELRGIGHRMPLTMAAFTVGAFGMMGVPPLAGFITKWYLGQGGAASGQGWVIAILVASSLLNAAYFLPIVMAAWFRPADPRWLERKRSSRHEARWWLLGPTVATGVFSVLAGLVANAPYSPLSLSKLVIAAMFP